MSGIALLSIGLIIVLILNTFLVWFVIKNRRGEKEDQVTSDFLFQQISELGKTVEGRMGDLTKTLDTRIGESNRFMHDSVRGQLSESQRLIQEITKELTEVKETGKQVVSFADQLQHLQDILKNPKQRGVLGEYYLETVLKNVLPPGRFEMQYKFDDGEIVDAVIFLDKDKILPIDSKFSLENYNRMIEARDNESKERFLKAFKQDLKIRIDETSKYIRPKDGTMDFAFMFIPSEGVYYDLLVGQVGALSSRDLIEYAFQNRKVIIVSPTSFLAYLQTVLQGLKSLQIEESAKQIIKNVGELEKHLITYEATHQKLGKSLSTTVNHFNIASREFKKIDKDVLKITGTGAHFETPLVERPVEEDRE